MDIVWILDNSGSMNDDMASVAANLKSFADLLASQNNVKSFLISSTIHQFIKIDGMSAPEAIGHYFSRITGSAVIDQYVGSNDGLLFAASALCPQTAKPGGYCERLRTTQALEYKSPYHSSAESQIAAALTLRSKLYKSLRSDSKKAFIFVTDDESNFSAANFLGSFQESYSPQLPTIFSVVATEPEGGACGARQGNAYQALAAQTGGQSYDICAGDWATKIESLVSGLMRINTFNVTLPETLRNKKILSILIGGQAIENGLFRVNGQNLSLSLSLEERIHNSGDEITVTYK
jgi:hypothetical protein